MTATRRGGDDHVSVVAVRVHSCRSSPPDGRETRCVMSVRDRLRHLRGAGAGLPRLCGDGAARAASRADLRRRGVPRARRARRGRPGAAAAAGAAGERPRDRVGLMRVGPDVTGCDACDGQCDETPVRHCGPRVWSTGELPRLVCAAQVLVEVDHHGPRGHRAESGARTAKSRVWSRGTTTPWGESPARRPSGRPRSVGRACRARTRQLTR